MAEALPRHANQLALLEAFCAAVPAGKASVRPALRQLAVKYPEGGYDRDPTHAAQRRYDRAPGPRCRGRGGNFASLGRYAAGFWLRGDWPGGAAWGCARTGPG